MTQIKAGHYAQHMLKFSPKIRLSMLIKKTCSPSSCIVAIQRVEQGDQRSVYTERDREGMV